MSATRTSTSTSSSTMNKEVEIKSVEKASSSFSSGFQSDHHQYVHDFVLGFADGLTVPFALTAGLSSLGSTKLVITGGLAELFSGAISMGLGSYLAAATERQRFDNEHTRKSHEIESFAEERTEKIYDIMCAYGVSRDHVKPFVDSLCQSREMWIQFIMDFELKIEKPQKREAYICALVMGIAYMLGGILPMIPYFIAKSATTALFISIGITAVVLLVFGFSQAKFLGSTKSQALYTAVKTLGIGASAAGASYGIVRAISSAPSI